MKIRNGFVSNSSSSSFIVAFPKKPKSVKDVLDYMFNGKEGGVGLEYYENGLSYTQVANKVFEDINHGNAQNGTLKNMIETMYGRYYYFANRGGCSVIGSNMDEDGGYWGGDKFGRYFGSNQKLMEEFKQATIDHDKTEEVFHKKERELIAKAGLVQPKWAYQGGIDSYTQKPYTKEEVKAHDKYMKDMEHFKKTDPEYVALEKKHRETSRKQWNEMGEMRRKLAEVDANNFRQDNKGKYIFIVSYADDSGWEGGIMEHGNIFRNVNHIKISNH